ncbi:fibrinogen-like protein 1 [Heptranchias perlo]|uniref:fibrinogen-like protein 1 n=1 Tax=Heptranchias perlo TaxID=212740 RepID=UPI00355984E7
MSGEPHNESERHRQVRRGLPQCGQYSNQALPNRRCRLIATLPQLEGQQCPDMFRCSEQVSYWLQENEDRKWQVVGVKEMMSQLQEELRNHQHRIKVLELQLGEQGQKVSALEGRVQQVEQRYSETNTLLHIHASLIYDMQTQVHSLSTLLDKAQRNSNCSLLHPLLEQPQHSDLQYIRNCPIDCASIYYNGVRGNGIYTIIPSIGGVPTRVYCDMDTAGGGWTMVQQRIDGSTDFNRGWKEYKEGFGELSREFWLGNDHIHDITSQGDYSLRIDLEDWDYRHKYGLYDSFSIEDEANLYRLHVGGFNGTVEDSFAWYHDKRSFSTPDTGNICAEISHGGWWYHQCFFSNLNGVYYKGGRYEKGQKPLGPDGVVWYSWRNSDYYSLKKVSMKIRPRNFRPHLSPD